MSKRAELQVALRPLDAPGIRAFLTAHSALPGPRANLELLAAFGDVAPATVILGLVGSDDEYLAACAAGALGRLVIEADGGRRDELVGLLHDQAADDRWRVREGVAMGLQRMGDVDAALLRDLVDAWVDDDDPLVQRAAVAGICEPRLLVDPETARCALAACATATASLARRPPDQRRRAEVRVLRQGLGYCWSVAIVADPVRGLPALAALEASTDGDVGWIVRENRKKARLIWLLDASR
ncbi:HEAT repeat domain-containing protein [Pengzhenrongella frigida]|uniref:HEAT repeat domain-containing protein n=1 Tax=Pengzhenrongella frigida TaxID=1259133 RepID=A0A4Q5N0Y9_9MICO|nr:HEAT repeat domain-containing protein [Cellulomonas sp. HLT2-17]RYV50903.1 HEAT repeat domain-containing protein [Cellulomonas sp. HLT2-17]